MSLEIIPISVRLTALGLQRLSQYIAERGPEAKYPVMEIGFGDANGTGYVPSRAQTPLRNEWGRFPVSPQTKQLSDGRIAFQCAVTGHGGKWCREIGIYMADGTLFGVASDPEGPFWQKQQNITQAVAVVVQFRGVDANDIGWIASGPDVNLIVDQEFLETTIAMTRMLLWWAQDANAKIKAITG